MSKSAQAFERATEFLSTLDGQVIKKSFIANGDIHIELLNGRVLVFTFFNEQIIFGELVFHPKLLH